MTSKAWQEHWGTEYRRDLRVMDLQPLLIRLQNQGLLGEVVVDVGSGAHPVSTLLSKQKIITLDIAGEESVSQSHLHIQRNIEDFLDLKSLSTQRALLTMARFLELEGHEVSLQQVDTFIFSQVLNYVHFQEILKSSPQFLRPNGRIIIANQPQNGYAHLFSDNGVKSNGELLHFLEQLPLEIEILKYPWDKTSLSEHDMSMLIAVLRKKAASNVPSELPTVHPGFLRALSARLSAYAAKFTR